MALSQKQKARKLEYQRAYRRRIGNAVTHRYEKTKSGFLMRAYRNMQSRVTGVQWKKAHLYEGLSLLPRVDFYAWAQHSPEFHALWDEWVASGFDLRLTPAVDRRDTEKGYVVSNMRWITHSENSRLGARSRHSRHSYRATILAVAV